MILSQKEFEALTNASMHGFTGAKQCARKKGFYGDQPLEVGTLNGLCNGHIVEVALCHLLGIVQRYVNYKFNVLITKELDLNGKDIVIETTHGTKYIQIKHTYRVGGREWQSGTYVLSTIRTGSEAIKHFMSFYKLPLDIRADKDIRRMFLELDYIWSVYMLDINEDYAKRF